MALRTVWRPSPWHAQRTTTPGTLCLRLVGLVVWLGMQCCLPGGGASADTRQPSQLDATTTSGVIVRAETLEYARTANRLTAIGAVEITYGDTRLFADRVTMDTVTGIGSAQGNVRLLTPEDDLRAARLDFELTTERGVLYQSSGMLAQSYLVTGKRVERLSADTFLVQDGRVTTCKQALPDWEFRAREAHIDLGDYITLKHPSLWIRGVPVFYVPYWLVPIKEARTTGFLTPQLGYSKQNGAEVLTQFYWAIADWVDATIGTDFLSEKGVMPKVEFRYAIDPLSDGQIEGAFIRELDTEETLWRVLVKQRQEFGWGLRALTHIDLRSDADLLRRFSRDLQSESAIRTASFGTLTKRLADASLTLAGESFEGIPESGFTSRFRRLPALRFQQFPTSLWGRGFFAVEASYTRFRSSQVVDDTPVQRLDVFPHVSVPISFAPWGRFTVVGGVRQTFYDHQTAASSGVSRTLGDLRAHLQGPTLWRRYARAGGRSAFIHLMTWRLDYRYVPRLDQDDVPAFERLDEAQHFLDPLEDFTLIDRIDPVNYAKIWFIHRAFTRTPGRIREVGHLLISQGLDVEDTRAGDGGLVGPLDIELEVRLWERWWLTSVARLLPASGEVQETNWRLGVTVLPGWRMYVDGRFRRDPDILQVSGGMRLTLREGFWLGYDLRFDALLGRVREHRGTVYYENPCHCWRVQASIRVRESGDTEFLVEARILP
jgi:lipopolysaccharide assembly outer membrane protein LptD (OstA)